jgi:cation diffusion facilitator CzcD-associated flavoprotein CzcO
LGRQREVFIQSSGLACIKRTSVSGPQIDIKGVGGASLNDKWADGPVTLLGILVDGFPNLMMVMGPHAGLGNFPRAVEYTYPPRTRQWRDPRRGDARGCESLDRSRHRNQRGVAVHRGRLLMTGINRNLEGKQVRRVMRYSGGHPAFRERCDGVSVGGYREPSMA